MLKSSPSKELIVVGGPNGSGKTTLSKELIAEQKITYISADDIAYELALNKPESVRIQSGKEFFRRLEKSVKNGENILIESTLSGRSLSSLIKKYKREYNYSVTVVFVYLANADICVKRVAIRVDKGGHEVPLIDIKRRFYRSLSNFWNLYRRISDNWYLFYNADDSFEEIARNFGKKQYVLDEELFRNFQDKMETNE